MARTDECLHELDGLLLQAGTDMLMHVHRAGDRRVPESLEDDLDHAYLDSGPRVSATEVVLADAGETRTFDEVVEPVTRVAAGG